MSNLARETAFVPLLGSSNGLFLAITVPWQFEIAAAVTANMALHENQKGFFRGCFCCRVITDIQGA